MTSSDSQQSSAKTVKHSFLGALDHITQTDPSKTWVIAPKDADLKTGWRNITYSELSYAVDGLASWIEKNVQVQSQNEVIAYMGINDIRYIVVELAIMKSGHKTMLPSPRNSIEGQVNLFKVTSCNILLHDEAFDTGVMKASVPGIKTYQIPTFDDLVQSGKDTGSFESKCSTNEDDVALVLHTSGSTGLPKPIYLTFGFIATLVEQKGMPAPAGRTNMQDIMLYSGKPMFTMMPFFHMIGFIVASKTFFDPAPLIVTPTGRPINSETIITILNQTKPDVGMFAPSVLEEISNTEEGLDAISQVGYVYYGGAPLAHEAGEHIKQRTRIGTMIGSTEAGLYPALCPEDPSDWNYLEWAPGSGITMEPDSDELFECVLKRNPDRRYQGVFHTFPDLEQEWRTKDLYGRHPTKPDLYEYRGRKDDVLVLSNGEKVQPVTFEKLVEEHSLVKGALVVGAGRFQTGLIIEPFWDKIGKDTTPEDLIDKLWPTVDRANQGIPAHGRVWRSKITISKKAKPFIRAPKGSIVRRKTVNAYNAEIDAMYSHEGFEDQLPKLDENSDPAAVKSLVCHAIALVCPDFSADASDDDDFFSAGIDSLQVLGLSNALSHACGGEKEAQIAPKDIYANPTVNALTNQILRARGQADAVVGPKREEIVLKMIEKYTHDLPERSFPATKPASTHVVILTGSTGGLGNLILQELINNPTVSEIYCLNRSHNAATRQRQSFEARSVPANFDKVAFLQTDFSQDHFGLDDATYDRLVSTATVFIHNAWAVDFNKALASYEQTHVAGTRRVVDFSLSSTHNTSIVFVSSVASLENWKTLHPDIPFVPEETFTDPRVTIPGGYSESKYIAEHILRIAATKSGVPSTVVRAGQLAGPSTEAGIWNPNEWVPSIVSTSKAMGIVPQTLGTVDFVDWVPLDVAANILLDLVWARVDDLSSPSSDTSSFPTTKSFDTYHLINPRTTTWSSLVPDLVAHFNEDTSSTTTPKVKSVPFADWVDALSKVPATKEEAAKKPGVKLLDFYQGLSTGHGELPRLESKKTESRSQSMRNLGAVDGELMGRWLRQWGL